jgi:hypothetical protein
MPPGLIRIDTLALLHGATPAVAYAVIENGTRIGQVALVLAQRPHGGTLRRLWWAIPPDEDTRPLPRPFDTRSAAVTALRYRHATLNRPQPPDPPDSTLSTVRAAYANAGPNAAVWLAASLTVHHLTELDANRQANPPSLWRELRRVVAWLQAATGYDHGDVSARSVHYRRTVRRWESRQPLPPAVTSIRSLPPGCDEISALTFGAGWGKRRKSGRRVGEAATGAGQSTPSGTVITRSPPPTPTASG